MDSNPKASLNLSKFCQMSLSRRLAQVAPLGISQAYLRCLGKLYYLRHPQEHELIRGTIRRVFGPRLQQPALERLIRRTFAGIFTHYHEKLFLAYGPEEKVGAHLSRAVHLQGTDALQEALAGGRGVILVTGHYGAVEFLPGALGLQGYPTAIIVRPQTKELALSLARRAALINLTLIIPEQGKVLPAALKALREGRILITEADEFEMWRVEEKRRVNFLGFPLAADRTLDVLQKRSGSPVLTALVRRERGRQYTLNIAPVGGAVPSQEVGRRCLKLLEQAILAAPEQWYQWKEFGKVIAAFPEPALAPIPMGRPVPAGHIPAYTPAFNLAAMAE